MTDEERKRLSHVTGLFEAAKWHDEQAEQLYKLTSGAGMRFPAFCFSLAQKANWHLECSKTLRSHADPKKYEMTDEERKKLCNLLRIAGYSRAADEIERLAEENRVLWAALPEGTTTVDLGQGETK